MSMKYQGKGKKGENPTKLGGAQKGGKTHNPALRTKEEKPRKSYRGENPVK